MDRGARQAKSMGSQRVGHDLVIEHKPHRLDLCVTELFVNEFMHFLVYYLCLDSLEIKKKTVFIHLRNILEVSSLQDTLLHPKAQQ